MFKIIFKIIIYYVILKIVDVQFILNYNKTLKIHNKNNNCYNAAIFNNELKRIIYTKTFEPEI